MRHDRRLSILGQPQLVIWAVLHQPEQVLRQRLVDSLENVARGAARLRQRRAHADSLTPLARKKECAHFRPCYEPPGRLGRDGANAKAGGSG